jgi:hypothetical protein
MAEFLPAPETWAANAFETGGTAGNSRAAGAGRRFR